LPPSPIHWVKIFTLKINLVKPINTPASLTFWSACLLVISMPVSPFLLSISMWALTVAALWQVVNTLFQEGKITTRKSVLSWLKGVVRSFQNLWANKSLAVMTLLLLVPAVSIFWSDDWAYWLRVTRVRLPFLILPWAFANLPTLDLRAHQKVLYLLVWYMALLCVGVGINFMAHYAIIMEGLGRGQPIPVPREHVRFSLILATAIVVGAWLWQQRFYLKFRWERKVLAAGVAFLFLFIHVLSVRGGLAVLYVAMISSIFWYVWATKRWLSGLATLAALVILLWGAVENIPSLRQRVAYMKYDLERYQANEGDVYSDSGRLISLQVGYRIWQQNPFLGVGAGDLLSEVKRVTAQEFPNYIRFPKLPHNQWLHIMASTGLFGLILSLAAFFIPVFMRENRRKYLFITFQIMVFITFIIECTVENAIGVSWCLFYTLWLLTIDR
jgi:O-antigen ligase